MEIDFWEKHIKPDVRPEPDGSESAGRVLKELYNEQQANTIAMFEQAKTVDELMAVKAQIKELETREEELKQRLILALDGNDEGLTEKFSVTWREQTRNTVDTKELKKQMPEIYERFLKSSKSRVLKINERKN